MWHKHIQVSFGTQKAQTFASYAGITQKWISKIHPEHGQDPAFGLITTGRIKRRNPSPCGFSDHGHNSHPSVTGAATAAGQFGDVLTRSPPAATADGAGATQPKPILSLSGITDGFATYHYSLPCQSLVCCVWSWVGSCNQPEPSAPFPVHITLIGPQLAWEIPKYLFLQTRSWVSFVLQSGETNSPLNHSLIYSFWLLLPPPSAAV